MHPRPGCLAYLGIIGVKLLAGHACFPQDGVHVLDELRVYAFAAAQFVYHAEHVVSQLVETRAFVRALEELDKAHTARLGRQPGVDIPTTPGYTTGGRPHPGSAPRSFSA